MFEWVGWVLSGIFEAPLAALTLVVAPIVAVVAFVTGDERTGWYALLAFGFALFYAITFAIDVARRASLRRSADQ